MNPWLDVCTRLLSIHKSQCTLSDFSLLATAACKVSGRHLFKHLAWVHDTVGIEDVFYLLHESNTDGVLRIVQRMRLHRTNAMLGRD